MPRKNKILIRTGSIAPTAADFATSEPAWDSAAGKFYIKNAAGVMVEIGGGAGSVDVYAYAGPACFPVPGQAAVIYLSISTSRIYQWVADSSVYVELGPLTIGDTTVADGCASSSSSSAAGSSSSSANASSTSSDSSYDMYGNSSTSSY